MSKYMVEVETLASGQPKPYADHRYEYKVTVLTQFLGSDDNEWEVATPKFTTYIARLLTTVGLPEVNGKRHTKLMMDKDDPERQWHESWVDEFMLNEDGTVFVRTKTPYID